MLLPQDILVALKLALAPRKLTYAELAESLQLSKSQVHHAVKRCAESGLVRTDEMSAVTVALREFLLHGVKYLFPAVRGPRQRGMPTAHAAPPLRALIAGEQEPVVWPDSNGDVRGESLEPIHRSVPEASRRDVRLYEALALLDAIRAGKARERNLAERLLGEILEHGSP